jgi:hypothetical protein
MTAMYISKVKSLIEPEPFGVTIGADMLEQVVSIIENQLLSSLF